MSILRFSNPTQTVRSIAPSTTNYFAPGAGVPTITTEALAQIVVADAGTISQLTVYLRINSMTTATTVFGVRVNGVDGACTVSVPAGSIGTYTNTVDTVTVADGDLVCFFVRAAAGGSGTCEILDVLAQFTVAGKQVQNFNAAQTATAYSLASTSYKLPLACTSITPTSTNETALQAQADAAGTWRDMGVYVESNTRGTTTTLQSRKNLANGNQVISIPAGATGQFRDTANTDSIAANDTMTYAVVTGTGAGVLLTRNVFSWFESTAGPYNIFADAQGSQISPFTTAYGPVPGASTYNNTLEIFAAPTLTRLRLSKLQVRVQANTANGALTMTSRVVDVTGSVVSSAQSVSIPAGATGLFQDTTNTDTVASGNAYHTQLATAATSGTVNVTTVGFLVENLANSFAQSCIF